MRKITFDRNGTLIEKFNTKSNMYKKLNEETKKHYIIHYTKDNAKFNEPYWTDSQAAVEKKKKELSDSGATGISTEIVTSESVGVSEIPSEETSSNSVPRTPDDMCVSSLIISSIQSEWDAIGLYNSVIASLDSINQKEYVDVIKDIIKEEMIHVGQLQSILKAVSPNTENIDVGKEEAEEQMASNGIDSIDVEESDDNFDQEDVLSSYM